AAAGAAGRGRPTGGGGWRRRRGRRGGAGTREAPGWRRRRAGAREPTGRATAIRGSSAHCSASGAPASTRRDKRPTGGRRPVNARVTKDYTFAVTHPYARDLDRNPANHVPLTPLSFIERAAAVYPRQIAVVYGDYRATWAETYARCRRLASALSRRGIGVGDTVAVMLPNIPAMYEAHFGVPMCGAVLNALNTRLDAEAIAFMLEHGEAKLLISDREFSPVVKRALGLLKRRIPVVHVEDPQAAGGERVGEKTYEELLAEGDPAFEWRWPADEWDAIALNYTSGTTGNP